MATKYDKRIERIMERDRGLDVIISPMTSDDERFEDWQILARARGSVVIRLEDAAL